MNNIKVSVIIPVYNTEKYLRDCLESVINQTLKDIEIICVNDGSTDNSLNILKEYEKKDSRIQITNSKCHCSGGARNKGLERAKGEYVGFVDADDWIDADYYEKLYKLAKDSDADITATSGVNIVKNNKIQYVKKVGACACDNPVDSLPKKSKIVTTTGVSCNKIYRLSFLKMNNIHFLELQNPSEDNYFSACAIIMANKIMFLDNTFYFYNSVSSSQTKTKKTQKDFVMTDVYKKIIDKINTYKLSDSQKQNWINVIKTRLATDALVYFQEMDNNLKKEFKEHLLKEFPDVSFNWPYKEKKIKTLKEKLLSCQKSEYEKHYIISILGATLKVRRRIWNIDKIKYINYVLNHQLDKSNFVPKTTLKHVFKAEAAKLIAFYLPQFHDFAENTKWFGSGFSEWSNTSKAIPQYEGHYQPHIPIDVGYYRLDNTDVMKKQIELAKHYGIYGFCFYYYWYSGHKIMEKPLENFLKDKSLNMPFFLFWANEDWTMMWDNGNEKAVLHKQELKDDDAEKFMADILPYMKDDRYIKIDNKPLFVLYELKKYPYEKYLKFVEKIRQIAKENGFDDLYIMSTIRNDVDLYDMQMIADNYKLDSILEFFPQGLKPVLKPVYKKIINPKFKGTCWNIKKFIKEKGYLYKNKTNVFKGCFTHWDNTARKCYNNTDIYENNPTDYKHWLKDIINWTKMNKPENEQFVFINAWNEWAEGAHLEPDQKYGYAYLQATKEALEETTAEYSEVYDELQIN